MGRHRPYVCTTDASGFTVIHSLRPRVGAGDVRLAAALGIFAGWAGWPCVVAFVVVAHLLALPFALWKLARHGADDVPFGPALVSGAYLAIALVGVAP